MAKKTRFSFYTWMPQRLQLSALTHCTAMHSFLAVGDCTVCTAKSTLCSRGLLEQLDGSQDILLVGVHDAAIHKHLIHNKVGLQHAICNSWF